RFTRRKGAGTSDDDNPEIATLTIVEHDGAKLRAIEEGVARGKAYAEAVNLARDLANEPSNHLTPTILADRALEVAASAGLEAKVLEEEDMRQKGMGSFLAVARGSDEPAKLVQLAYRGHDG